MEVQVYLLSTNELCIVASHLIPATREVAVGESSPRVAPGKAIGRPYLKNNLKQKGLEAWLQL
jgi:hypothetical protein